MATTERPPLGAKLVKALMAARGAFKPARKIKENPHFKSKYADLAEVLDATEDALTANNLAVVQKTRVDEQGRTILVTTLAHVEGETVQEDTSEYPVIPVKADPQSLAAALTYARRYSYMASLGIAPEDDDGNAASRPPAPAKEKARAAAAPNNNTDFVPEPDPAELIGRKERDELTRLLAQHKRTWHKVAAWLSSQDGSDFPVDGQMQDLTFAEYRRILKALNTSKPRRSAS